MPLISVIVPCLNEQNTISLLLEAINNQTFPIEDIEVIIADGGSTDRTIEVIRDFQSAHPRVKIQVIQNHKGTIPAGLNSAIKASSGKFIVRLDAHSVPEKSYLERCYGDLVNRKAENVGGLWEIKPGGEGWVAKSIAAAASHPFAVGDARYRYSNQPGYVDTVPFGSYRRTLFDEVGLFDESLLTNEDYELNTRIRLSGGKIWFDPDIRSVYFARPDFTSLARQYWRYGYWKFKMLKRYPSTIRWRQALPPIFLAGIVFLILAGLLNNLAWISLGFLMSVYFLILLTGSIPGAITQRNVLLLLGVPFATFVMHFFWGAGFWNSLIKSLFGK